MAKSSTPSSPADSISYKAAIKLLIGAPDGHPIVEQFADLVSSSNFHRFVDQIQPIEGDDEESQSLVQRSLLWLYQFAVNESNLTSVLRGERLIVEVDSGYLRTAPVPVDLATMPYDEYLKTEHWQTVRSGAIERAGGRCQLCNDDRDLHVHHRTYERRGSEEPTDVVALCKSCHERFHEVVNGRPTRMPGKTTSNSVVSTESDVELKRLLVGQEVRHNKFGLGVVDLVNAYYTITFRDIKDKNQRTKRFPLYTAAIEPVGEILR